MLEMALKIESDCKPNIWTPTILFVLRQVAEKCPLAYKSVKGS